MLSGELLEHINAATKVAPAMPPRPEKSLDPLIPRNPILPINTSAWVYLWSLSFSTRFSISLLSFRILPVQRGFYIAIAIIPLSYAIHQYSFSDEQNPPLPTRLINKYLDYRDRWAERNETHTRMIEVAANDRNLFLNSRPAVMRELEFPEWVAECSFRVFFLRGSGFFYKEQKWIERIMEC